MAYTEKNLGTLELHQINHEGEKMQTTMNTQLGHTSYADRIIELFEL